MGPFADVQEPQEGMHAPMPRMVVARLHVKLDVQRQRRLGQQVALEVGQEAVQAAPGAALAEVGAARLQQHAHQADAEAVEPGGSSRAAASGLSCPNASSMYSVSNTVLRSTHGMGLWFMA